MARPITTRGSNVFTRVKNAVMTMNGGFTNKDVKVVAVKAVEVSNAMRKLEREGVVKRTGNKKVDNKRGRRAVIWERV